MRLPELGTVVFFRSRTGDYTMPAMVTARHDTLHPAGVEGGHLPAITAKDRLHLTIFTPGLPPDVMPTNPGIVIDPDRDLGDRVVGPFEKGTELEGNQFVGMAQFGGTYAEYDIPWSATATTAPGPDAGGRFTDEQDQGLTTEPGTQAPGTWAWRW